MYLQGVPEVADCSGS